MSYQGNIVETTKANTFFRQVVFTGAKSQLVVMDLKPGEDIGEEVHAQVEQTLFFVSGTARAVLDGKESMLTTGDVLIVSPGTRHNVINAGTESLKLYTVYTPANHIDGRVHRTKADAVADTEDEAFGEVIR